MNQLTGAPTTRVLFGYLSLDESLIHAVDQRGRPDTDRLIGVYRPGTEPPMLPMGKSLAEAIVIEGKSHPICAGMTDKAGRRKNGVVLIDATHLQTGP
ncbi:hypothetical protein GCM10019059_39950 [Camelimonas fluminis]|uniref:Uncharacterized protein n=1 Tax=Camelimonas fluminis TaxID=1576911 RepID=A0ABV7UK72_9HYPH|nr:hypothetical protein [Camelimonas fluminis]GHE76704.1 hypothetical protein GCM10019059_39950 [Camelimonas fluminis]